MPESAEIAFCPQAKVEPISARANLGLSPVKVRVFKCVLFRASAFIGQDTRAGEKIPRDRFSLAAKIGNG